MQKNIKYSYSTQKKYARGNHIPFMNKALSKEIMPRTRLRNKFLKDRSEKNKKKYSKQRNYCVCLLRKSKSDISEILMRQIFWKTIKPFLSNKVRLANKMTLWVTIIYC